MPRGISTNVYPVILSSRTRTIRDEVIESSQVEECELHIPPASVGDDFDIHSEMGPAVVADCSITSNTLDSDDGIVIFEDHSNGAVERAVEEEDEINRSIERVVEEESQLTVDWSEESMERHMANLFGLDTQEHMAQLSQEIREAVEQEMAANSSACSMDPAQASETENKSDHNNQRPKIIPIYHFTPVDFPEPPAPLRLGTPRCNAGKAARKARKIAAEIATLEGVLNDLRKRHRRYLRESYL
ncbi:hypothetical protein JR316_0000148 [Psilocybe cubensis]|uniref:Uncharacterized protein n=3 Tax=Psilocybe cubensis TaxID=181762 RepID=A0A8H7XV07_PSICU|nr:hypothetical protein JR316_0011701 [Psilocybe cubensis]XP_047753709.1 hypothetical protein JR316_0000148 [Psilocybe cubensis]KAH9476130.1 hypothetical protein JR316_0011701 [Psilocybe cubensis]KAH9486084.1 hypothetical protein JR316_0000148 [Psilocybe cubensis]